MLTETQLAAAERLSPRHRECLRLVYRRYTSKEIAAELGIGVGTVNSYIKEAVAMLGARNRRHAAEMLFGDEDREGNAQTPYKIEADSSGVASGAQFAPQFAPSLQPPGLFELLPSISKGIPRNELAPARRVFWILQLGSAVAIGFGMLVVGLDVISRLLVASG
ncbi:MAG: helix-turn-helix transcriptional regulator [Novosphingobium sp.]